MQQCFAPAMLIRGSLANTVLKNPEGKALVYAYGPKRGVIMSIGTLRDWD